jgi:hypothetical protein
MICVIALVIVALLFGSVGTYVASTGQPISLNLGVFGLSMFAIPRGSFDVSIPYGPSKGLSFPCMHPTLSELRFDALHILLWHC